MQTNRDDFIIAIRSAFLKKGNQQRFSLIALILFSIFIIVLGKYNFKGVNFLQLSIKEIVYRTTFIVSVPENFAISSYQKIRDHFNLYWLECPMIENEDNIQNIKAQIFRI